MNFFHPQLPDIDTVLCSGTVEDAPHGVHCSLEINGHREEIEDHNLLVDGVSYESLHCTVREKCLLQLWFQKLIVV